MSNGIACVTDCVDDMMLVGSLLKLSLEQEPNEMPEPMKRSIVTVIDCLMDFIRHWEKGEAMADTFPQLSSHREELLQIIREEFHERHGRSTKT